MIALKQAYEDAATSKTIFHHKEMESKKILTSAA